MVICALKNLDLVLYFSFYTWELSFYYPFLAGYELVFLQAFAHVVSEGFFVRQRLAISLLNILQFEEVFVVVKITFLDILDFFKNGIK